MTVLVLRASGDIAPFLELVKAAADANKQAIGFLPGAAYEQSSYQGRLWVAVTADAKLYLGHLLFGGTYPDLRVFQLYVEPTRRRAGIGSRLVRELVGFGESQQYLAITARVAADLPANQFWAAQQFVTVKTIAGGKTTGRLLNIRVRVLDAPRLFDLPAAIIPAWGTLTYDSTPLLGPPIFAIDINVILDLIATRLTHKAAGALVRGALNHVMKLVVTDEARRELERSRAPEGRQDPLLEFIRHLPTLPQLNQENLAALVEELRQIVFPDRGVGGRGAKRDESDLLHLASCIHHGISGFVTSDAALLRNASHLARRFGLEVVSPFGFIESPLSYTAAPLPLVARMTSCQVTFANFEEPRRSEVECFVRNLGVPSAEMLEALNPGTVGSERRRICAFEDGELAGVAVWQRVSTLRRKSDLFLYIDESKLHAERIAEHFLGSVLDEGSQGDTSGIYLRHGPGQAITRDIAVRCGFRSIASAAVRGQSLFKVSMHGIVNGETWPSVAKAVKDLAGVSLPTSMPTFSVVEQAGLPLIRGRGGDAVYLRCFELETVFSPGLFLFQGRTGVMIPIRKEYANRLLGGIRVQTTFLPVEEALLRLEKAYFRYPTSVNLIRKGMPIIFYVSGLGEGHAVGSARVTATAVMSASEAAFRYERQGVLPKSELERRADKKGNLHVIVFDNFYRFRKAISYHGLKKLGCVGRSNLQTIEPLDARALSLLLIASSEKERANRE